MRAVHEANAFVLIGVNAVAGAWCLASHRWRSLQGRAMWGAVIVAQVLVFAQAAFGAALSRQAGVELGDMHALYGFSGIVAAMMMYGYRSTPQLRAQQHLLYGFGSLFVMGLGLRNLFLH